MLQINKNNEIVLTRGDSAVLELLLSSFYEDGSVIPYIPEEDDEVTFTMKASCGDCSPILLQKQLLDYSYFYLKPADTENIPIGVYYYDVQIKTEDGDIFTVVPPSKIKLAPEVNKN